MTLQVAGRRIRPERIVVWLLALALAMISSFPILWIVLTSFKTFVETQANPPVWIPDFTNIQAYVVSFVTGKSQAGSAWGPLVHSLIVATGTMIVTMLLAIPAAYALARYTVRRKNDIQFWFISSRMMPLIAGIVPLATMLDWLKLNDTLEGLIIVYVSFNLSFAVWLLSIFFASVPRETEEAARIDGLSRWGALVHVTFPLARASIVVIAIFTWIFSWNELLAAIVLTTGKTQTLPVLLSSFATNTLTFYDRLAAVGTVQVIPAVLIVFFAQRYIVSGMSMGAVTGE
jgi:ABC-type glycerol-3-phosphate transport system permease component